MILRGMGPRGYFGGCRQVCLSTAQKACAAGPRDSRYPVCWKLRRAERETSGADGRQVALVWALLGDMDSSVALIRRGLEKTP